MSTGRIPQVTTYKSTDWVYLDIEPLGGSPSWKAAPISTFFANVPSGVNVGLGLAAYDNWGITQLWNTGSPATNYNCGAVYAVAAVDWETDNNNDGYGIRTQISVKNGTPAGGFPSSHIVGVDSQAYNLGTNSELDKIIGGNFEGRQYGLDVAEVYAVMAQSTNISSQSGDTTKITGIFADAYTSISTGAVAVGTLYGAELRTFSKTNTAATTSAVTTAYGLYSALYCQQEAASTSTIGTAYNIYLTDLRPGGGIDYGPVTTYYGLYIDEPTKATTNYSVYVEGRSHFDQPTNDAAVPVLALDQADLSEGFIDYLGTSAASAVGPISSWTAGNTIQGFVRVEINGTAYWMPYYDAPTS